MARTRTTFKCIKTSLKSIIKNDINIDIIKETVIDMNRLVTYAYQFIRLFILHKFHNGQKLPIVNKKFIFTVLRILGKKGSAVGAKAKNIELCEELIAFKDSHFVNTFDNYDPPSYNKKTQILDYIAVQMCTSYDNNIKLHWIKRLIRTIRTYFPINKGDKDALKMQREYIDWILSNGEKGYVYEKYKIFNDELKTYLPIEINKSIPYHLEASPSLYILSTIWLSKKIEDNYENKNENEHGSGLSQCLPLRTTLVPCHITLDTSCIMNLFVTDGITKLMKNIKNNANDFWDKYFNINSNKKLRIKGYIFHNMIDTNGFTASVLFSRIDADAKTHSKLKTKSSTDVFEVKKLSDLDPMKYINSNAKIVGCDPGHSDLLYMIDDNKKIFRYSSIQRRFECYHKRSRQVLSKEQYNHGIDKIQSELTNLSSKTTYPLKFSDYLIQRHSVDKRTHDFYEQLLFRKMAWRRYVKTQQSEQKLIENIEDKYGSDCIIGYGNWSRTSHQKYLRPVPNKGLLKLISQNFNVYIIDEYCSSKKCHNCTEDTEKFRRRVSPRPRPWRKDAGESLVHGLLRCKSEKCNTLWNRDVNGSLNIRQCLDHHINGLTRPAHLLRPCKLNDKDKVKIRINIKLRSISSIDHIDILVK